MQDFVRTFFVIYLTRFRNLSHPNIINCYGFFNTVEKCGTVSEYMSLGSLQTFLTEMNPALITKYIPRIAMDVARAMEHIHSKGIVYGRLKSSNVLLKGVVYGEEIVGLEVKVDIDITTPNETIEEQMGPFLTYEKNSRQDQTMDIYSYGMLLNHMFSEGDILPKDACKSSVTLSRFPPQWKELILECTQKDATERPQSFSSVIAVLSQLVKL
jgi:serine/threonine protein kinase